MLTFIVIVFVTAALIIGVTWGNYWGLSEKTEGFRRTGWRVVAGGSKRLEIGLSFRPLK